MLFRENFQNGFRVLSKSETQKKTYFSKIIQLIFFFLIDFNSFQGQGQSYER